LRSRTSPGRPPALNDTHCPLRRRVNRSRSGFRACPGLDPGMKPGSGRKERWNISGRPLAHARGRCAITVTTRIIFLGSSPRTWFGALCAYRAVGAAVIMPAANSEAMSVHLKEISTQVSPDAHAILVCDGAGWHQRGDKLTVPDNITLLPLPVYSPELHPMENVWDYCAATNSATQCGTPMKRLLKHVRTHGAS
jgi:hypothetical protein